MNNYDQKEKAMVIVGLLSLVGAILIGLLTKDAMAIASVISPGIACIGSLATRSKPDKP